MLSEVSVLPGPEGAPTACLKTTEVRGGWILRLKLHFKYRIFEMRIVFFRACARFEAHDPVSLCLGAAINSSLNFSCLFKYNDPSFQSSCKRGFKGVVGFLHSPFSPHTPAVLTRFCSHGTPCISWSPTPETLFTQQTSLKI